MTLHPLTAAIADNLASMFPEVDRDTRHELEGIASLAAALTLFHDKIKARGCGLPEAGCFMQVRNSLNAELDELAEYGFPTDGTWAAVILRQADRLAAVTLALMPPAGNA